MDPEQFKQFLAKALLWRDRSRNASAGIAPPVGEYRPVQVPPSPERVHAFFKSKYKMTDKEARMMTERLMSGAEDWPRDAGFPQPTTVFHYADPSAPTGFGYRQPSGGPEISVSGSRTLR